MINWWQIYVDEASDSVESFTLFVQTLDWHESWAMS